MIESSSRWATARAWSTVSRAEPATWGAQRIEYASCTRWVRSSRWLATTGESASRLRRLAAERAWPACGRMAMRSAAKARSVPSSASMLMAVVTSATFSSRSRSASARASIPSMPSVPLISARPSFSARVTGARPAWASASPAGRVLPSAIADPALALQDDSHVRQRREVAAAAQGTVLVDGRRDAGVEQSSQCRHDLGAHAGPARAQRVQAQGHHGAHDLGLDQRTAAGSVRPGQAHLQGSAAVPGGWRWWPGHRTRWTPRRSARVDRPGPRCADARRPLAPWSARGSGCCALVARCPGCHRG